MLAVGTNLEEGIPPSIGFIEIRAVTWTIDEGGLSDFMIRNLQTHACSSRELGLLEEGSSASLFPIKNPKVAGLQRRKYLCVDEEELLLYG